MYVTAKNFIEGLRNIFYICFDIMNDIRINDILEMSGDYIRIFVFDDGR
jgi:hypothetical protein